MMKELTIIFGVLTLATYSWRLEFLDGLFEDVSFQRSCHFYRLIGSVLCLFCFELRIKYVSYLGMVAYDQGFPWDFFKLLYCTI